MNQELNLFSITKKRKSQKVFENKAKLYSRLKNQKWCTDFNYLFLTDSSKQYNCLIINLDNRSLIASITDKYMTSESEKRASENTLVSHPRIDMKNLMPHSKQGSEYTLKEFTDFCTQVGITQSMNKVEYPYDNAPIERYFNTLKNELI